MIVIKKEKLNLKAAATYISTPDRSSIIGDGRLDFQVRNGAGYCPPSSPTTKRDKYTLCILISISIELLRLTYCKEMLKIT